jgi:hypothetical protein
MSAQRKLGTLKTKSQSKNINNLLGILNRRPKSVSGSIHGSGRKKNQSAVFSNKRGANRYQSNKALSKSKYVTHSPVLNQFDHEDRSEKTMSFAGDHNKKQRNGKHLFTGGFAGVNGYG